MKQRYLTLADFLEQTGTTQKELADRLGVTSAYISMVAAGKRQPKLHLALRIHKETGVPLESMVTEDNK